MTQAITCPIWGTPAVKLSEKAYGDRARIQSPRAGGEYVLSGSAAESVLRTFDDSARLRLTDWILDQRRAGDVAPYIDSDVLQRMRNSQIAPPSASQRYDRLLEYFEASAGELGGVIKVHGNVDEELIRRQAEMRAHTSSLKDTEVYFLLDQAEKAGHTQSRGSAHIQLSLDGYNYVASLHSRRSDSKQAFIAMWFDKSMSEAYEQGIEPAVKDAGYVAMRIDKKEHSNKVDDEIIAEIRRSRFLIADFTSERDKPRGGVYFEAGFAQGLGLPVIWTCRADLIDQLHFDTRQFNHIVWNDSISLRVALRNRVIAVVGPGPLQTLP